jgi:glycosyltransferase involved in cell wall biosynthesis
MISTSRVRLPISAIVASRNEASELRRCLPTLAFCDEIIVVDLESSDDTAAVAAAHGARVIRHPVVPIAEYARVHLVGEARHEWLLFTDPDEELPAELAEEIGRLLPTLEPDVALVWAPIQFYFGRRPLAGTIWGGENRRRLLVRPSGVELTATVFGGTRLRPGFRAIELPYRREIAIRHHWVAGYRDWVRKHRRYFELDRGKRLRDQPTSVRAAAAKPVRSFYRSFFEKKGYRDGVTGLGLSILWAAYETASEVALLLDRRRGA